MTFVTSKCRVLAACTYLWFMKAEAECHQTSVGNSNRLGPYSFIKPVAVSKIGSLLTSDSARELVEELIAQKGKCARADKPRMPTVSFLIQHFRRPLSLQLVIERLMLYEDGQVIVNDDSGEDHKRISRLLGENDVYINLKDVHEIRSYNMLSRVSDGEILCFLQDDDIPPTSTSWVENAVALFQAHPKLSMLGGLSGWNLVTRKGHNQETYGQAYHGRAFRELPFLCPYTNQSFMFVQAVNLGPIFVRSSVFFEVGQFLREFSCPGSPGMYFETELSLRMWELGWQVGVYDAGNFRHHVVGDIDPKTMKTNKDYAQYRAERSFNGKKNREITHALYGEKFKEHMKKIERASTGLIRISQKQKVRKVKRNGKRDKIQSLANFKVEHYEID